MPGLDFRARWDRRRPDRGGHLAAMVEPGLMVAELRASFEGDR